jgi:3'-5' exonuclease
MSDQTVVVWDLETIPDIAAAARMLDLGTATEAEVREALGPGFPKHPLHKIVRIGALVANRQPEGWRVDALGAPHTGKRPEAELKHLPTGLVSFGPKCDLERSRLRPPRPEISRHGQPGIR